MSFGEGNLHEENERLESERDALQAEARTLRGYVMNLEDKVDSLKDVNGKLCDEINRQERVIEELREKEAAYMDANHEQGMQLIEQDKRIRELESLLADVWPYVWELRIPGRRDEEFEARFDELGLEASE